MTDADIKDLIGKTLVDISINDEKDEIRFTDDTGKSWRMYHSQDCCETVKIEEIIGEIKDLIGSTIIEAEVVTHKNETPPEVNTPEYPDCYTWTFYKLGTQKGFVTLRWLGESNGWYSEEVSFEGVGK